ncbi:MAG: HEAT repeat domain-containing protein [Isosphaeraceae bacterium]
MRWLAGKLGLRRLLDAEVILPEHRFFPDPFSGAPDDARRVFDRVARYMGLDPARLDLEVVPDEAMQGAAGLYLGGDPPRILLAAKQLSDPERLVATIAHELAHEILLGGGLITTDSEDHEPLTDLLPVFLGLGVFLANAPVRDRSYTQQNWSYFQINKQGYLPSHTLGYALALFAHARKEENPPWARHLRLDAAKPFRAGLRYLFKTNDSLFLRATADRPVAPPTEAEALERLARGSPTVRAATLVEIASMERPPASLVAPVSRLLRGSDEDVRSLAAWALLPYGPSAKSALPDLYPCAWSSEPEVRRAAATVIPRIGGHDPSAVAELSRFLGDADWAVVDAAALGLAILGQAAAPSIPALVEAMRRGEADCHSSDALAAALIAIEPSAEALRPLLDPIDREFRRPILQALQAARSRRASVGSAEG